MVMNNRLTCNVEILPLVIDPTPEELVEYELFRKKAAATRRGGAKVSGHAKRESERR